MSALDKCYDLDRGRPFYRQRPLAAGGSRQRIFEHFNNIGVQALPIADNFQTNAVLDELGQVRLDEPPHQPHQIADFLVRAFPVLAREGVERQAFEVDRLERPHEPAHRLDAALMAHGARQVVPLRPAAVPIHDDRDVAGFGLAVRHYPKTRLEDGGILTAS